MSAEAFQITVEDFDAAVRQRWTANTCLVAQAFMRATGIPLYDHNDGGFHSAHEMTHLPNKISEAMSIFDSYFKVPGDELARPELIELRKSLPIDVEL